MTRGRPSSSMTVLEKLDKIDKESVYRQEDVDVLKALAFERGYLRCLGHIIDMVDMGNQQVPGHFGKHVETGARIRLIDTLMSLMDTSNRPGPKPAGGLAAPEPLGSTQLEEPSSGSSEPGERSSGAPTQPGQV